MFGRKKRAYHPRAAVAEVLERRLLLDGTVTAVKNENLDVGDLDGGDADVIVPAGVSVTANQVRVNQLTIDGKLSINPNPNGILDPTGASFVNTLVLATNSSGAFTGTLDLGNNVLIINEPSEDAALDEYNIIWSAIQTGYNSDWLGPGIISSAAANDPTDQTSIGVAIVNQLFGGETVEWSGQTINSDDIIVAVTDAGDADLNGVVDLNDFDQWLYGYTGGGNSWAYGNFDYNGVVDLNDFNTWLDSYTTTQLPLSTVPQGPITPPNFEGTYTPITDPDSSVPLTDLSSTINWGSGQGSSPGAIVSGIAANNGYFQVFGDHEYTSDGVYNATTTVTDSTGVSWPSDHTTILVGTDFLSPPADLTGTYKSPTEIDLSWEGSSGVTYSVYELENGTWASLGTIGPFTSPTSPIIFPATNTTVPYAADSAYIFKVIPTTSNSTGNASTVNVSTPAYPGAPTLESVVANSPTQVTLTWSENDQEYSASSFTIQRENASTGVWTPLDIVGGSTTSYLDITATENTQFNYRVIASAAGGDSLPSNLTGVTTPPAAPSNLAATITSTGVAQLTWTNESATAQYVSIDWSADNGATWTNAGGDVLAANGAPGPYNISISGGFNPSDTYYFRIRALSGYYNYSPYDGPIIIQGTGTSGSTPPIPAPEAPSGLTAIAVDDNQIDLNWVDNSTIQTGFDIQRSDVGSSGPWTDLGTVDANTFSYTDLDPALTPDTTYYYQVAALNGTAESAFCVSPPVTTFLAAPTEVTAVANASGTDITVTWSDPESDVPWYFVQESTNGVTWNTVGQYVEANSFSVPDSPNLYNFDDPYYFKVQAANTFYSSVYSQPVLADMSALAPTGGLSSGDGSSSGSGSSGPTGWSYVEVDAVSVPSDGNEVESHISLNSGGQYEIVASGYCTIGNGALGYTDASWTGFGKMPIDLSQTSPSGLQYGVFINGSDPGWGAYQSSHVYTINYTGSGGPLSFYFSDDFYPDNSGSIGVTILAWEPNQNNNNNNNAPQYPLAGMQVGDLAHAANSVYTDGSTTPTLYVPEAADGSVNLILTGQFYVGTTWSITGSNASPASGTFSSISQEVTLTPTGGNDDFTVTASEDGASESANVVVQPWEIDATTLPSSPTATPPLLAQNQKLSPGALVQVDDGDFNNDGYPDDQEPNGGPPPSGDPSLMQAVLNATGDSGSGDYYSIFNLNDFVRMWYQPSTGGAYAPVEASTKFPSDTNTTVYMEGVRDGTDVVSVDWTVNGMTYYNADDFTANVYPGLIRTDANRDGTISFTPSTPSMSDRTSTSNPYRFWINDSDSVTNSMSAQTANDYTPDQESLISGQTGYNGPDSQLNVVPDTLDLENWFPVVLQMPPGYNDNTWTTNFTMVGANSPSIKAFFVTQSQEQQYLTNENVAQQIVTTFTNGRQIIYGLGSASNAANGPGDWSPGFIPDGSGKVYMLVEGVSAGIGALTATFSRMGVAVAQDSVNLDLQTISQFYETWTVGNGSTPTGAAQDLTIPTTATVSPSNAISDRSAYTKDYILFVPGWRVTPVDAEEQADVAYERLYWQGFKGRFGVYVWPTEYTDTGLGTMLSSQDARDNFDNSEDIAFQSAPALLNLLQGLDSAHYSVNVLAHSLGNVVVSEALREDLAQQDSTLTASGEPVQDWKYTPLLNTYVASQAAMPADAYDENQAGTFATTYGPLLTIPQSSTPNVYVNSGLAQSGTIPYFFGINQVATEMFNFFNPGDAALTNIKAWPLDQATKPDVDVPSATIVPVPGGNVLTAPNYYYEYGYDASAGTFYRQIFNLSGLNVQTGEITYSAGATITLSLSNQSDFWAIMSYAAEIYSTALGATANVAGPFNANYQVNLSQLAQANNLPTTAASFSTNTYDHSGQFYHDNMTEQYYWNLAMKRFGLLSGSWADVTPNSGGRP